MGVGRTYIDHIKRPKVVDTAKPGTCYTGESTVQKLHTFITGKLRPSCYNIPSDVYKCRPAKSPGIFGSLQKWGVISRSPGIVKKTPGIEGI